MTCQLDNANGKGGETGSACLRGPPAGAAAVWAADDRGDAHRKRGNDRDGDHGNAGEGQNGKKQHHVDDAGDAPAKGFTQAIGGGGR